MKPCKKGIDESRFFATLHLPLDILEFNQKIIDYFRLYFTYKQTFYTKEVMGYDERIHFLFMDDYYEWRYINGCSRSLLNNRYNNYTLHLRIGKVFLGFLLSYSFKVDKRGRTIPTKQLLFLEQLEMISVNLSSYSLPLKKTNNTYYETIKYERQGDLKAFKKTLKSLIKDYRNRLEKSHRRNLEKETRKASFTLLFRNCLLIKCSSSPPGAQVMFPSPRLLNLFVLLIIDRFDFPSDKDMKTHMEWTMYYMAHTYYWIKSFEQLID